MNDRPAGAHPPDVRRHNLSRLLRLLHLRGPMRRSELTDLSGLNRSTVAGLVAELAALGAVREEPPVRADDAGGPGGIPGGPPGVGRPDGGRPGDGRPGRGRTGGRQARAGRPSALVRPCPENVQVLAADVAVGQVSMALIGLGGALLERCSRQLHDASATTVAGVLADLGRELLGRARAAPRVVGLGVSIPGVVRIGDGHVRFAPNLGWVDQPLGDLLVAALAQRGITGVRVALANDGDLGVLAEHQRGVARGYDDVVFVEGETGVGCGVICAGRSLRGSGGYAGELGHLTIRRNGLLCRCGARGCWETEIGAGALARALGLPEEVGEAEVGRALRTGGAATAGRLQDVAEYLGIGLANLVNVFNPRLIVLGGLLRDLYPLLAGQVDEVLAASALRAPAEQVRLVLPELGADAVLLGAGEFACRELLADPAAVLATPPA